MLQGGMEKTHPRESVPAAVRWRLWSRTVELADRLVPHSRTQKRLENAAMNY